MNKNRSLSIVSTLLSALALAACGGGGGTATNGPGVPAATTAGGTTQPPGAGTTQAPGGIATIQPGGALSEACPLLTEADIKAATGYDTKTATEGPQMVLLPAGCQWELIGDDAIPPAIRLGIMSVGGKAYYQSAFEPYNVENGYEAVQGVGDVAFKTSATTIMVVSGDAFFILEYLDSGKDEQALATELAKKVVANLGG